MPEGAPQKPTELDIEKLQEKIVLLANLLQKAKAVSGKSLRQISEELSRLGITVGNGVIHGWGDRNKPTFPQPDKLEAIAKVYGVDLKELTSARAKGVRAQELEQELLKNVNLVSKRRK